MLNKESKHAANLRELGCLPLGEFIASQGYSLEATYDLVKKGDSLPIRWKTRSTRKRMIAQGLLPFFSTCDGFLMIIDERGNEWKGSPEIKGKLVELGFDNGDLGSVSH